MLRRAISPHFKAVCQALLVTFLWSTSWVLIKIGLTEIPALTFAGLRYLLAFGCLVPVAALSRRVRQDLRSLTAAGWVRLGLLGLTLYAMTQGAQFGALAHLPAQTTSLLWNFSTVVVALAGVVVLAERPTGWQWIGMALYLTGAAIFLLPAAFPAGQLIGIGIAIAGVLANSAATLIGRAVNRQGGLSPLTVTVLSMGIGALVLFASGVASQGLPSLSGTGWLMVGWLAVVNTAVAFTLWNLTQRTLSATESSIINSTMLFQIALLAWLFLGESLGLRQIAGLSLAALGVLLVQLGGALPVSPASRARIGPMLGTDLVRRSRDGHRDDERAGGDHDPRPAPQHHGGL